MGHLEKNPEQLIEASENFHFDNIKIVPQVFSTKD
jgi:hypothetical protein